MRWVLFGAAVASLLALSCERKPTPTAETAPSGPVSSASPIASSSPATSRPAEHPVLDEPAGDADRGKALVAQFECSRCHEGTGTTAATMEKQCFACHVKIISGELKGPKGAEARWHDRVLDLKGAPTLTASQKRFDRRWLTSFLMDPYDLRPRLAPTMPRLALTREQARDIATYLAGPDAPAGKADAFAGANAEHGRKLMEDSGCASCHLFTGAAPFPNAAPFKMNEKALASATQLAPDLRFARDRLRPDALLAWVASPKSVKPDTLMPEFSLSPGDARDIAFYLTSTKLADPPAHAAVPRLPILDRRVTFDEVSTKVFRRTCWHCHGEPDYAAGDGGPGNTGGFGFKPRGISFVDYGSVAAGREDDQHERHSLFEKTADGTPMLVKALLARRDEEAGHPDKEARGMPLGYPSLSPEDVQLVETWIAEGRPR